MYIYKQLIDVQVNWYKQVIWKESNITHNIFRWQKYF